jgi:hypothetical protein
LRYPEDLVVGNCCFILCCAEEGGGDLRTQLALLIVFLTGAKLKFRLI